jgi:CheY-like chemotaxis protein
MKINSFFFKKTIVVFLATAGILSIANVGNTASVNPEHKDSTQEQKSEQWLGQKGFLGKPNITNAELFAVLSLVGLSILTPELLRRKNTKKEVKEINGSKKHVQVSKFKGDRESIPGSKLFQKIDNLSTHPDVQSDLMDALQQMIQQETETPNTNRTAKISSISLESSSKSKILIVDDSAMVREMLSLTFATAGYQTEQACDGQEALEKLRAGLSCDLILSDIEMPRMDGLELLIRLREDEKLAAIPVAMLTSYGDQKIQRMATQRGAKGYFLKPYIEAAMIDAAKRIIAGEVLLGKNDRVARQQAA